MDAVTYTVNSTYPLRLEKEEVPPGGISYQTTYSYHTNQCIGDNCGASYLNENFREVLEERLKHESYLFRNGETKESVVGRLIPDFENEYKRRIDVTGPCKHNIHIAGLRGDEDRDPKERITRDFERNSLIMRK